MNGQLPAPRFASEYRKAQNAIVAKWFDSFIGNDQVRHFKISQRWETISDTNSEALSKGYADRFVKRSINELLNKFTNNKIYVKSQPFVSGYVDVNPVRNAYLTRTGLGNFNTMSLTGDRNIIKKIPINGKPGDVIYD